MLSTVESIPFHLFVNIWHSNIHITMDIFALFRKKLSKISGIFIIAFNTHDTSRKHISLTQNYSYYPCKRKKLRHSERFLTHVFWLWGWLPEYMSEWLPHNCKIWVQIPRIHIEIHLWGYVPGILVLKRRRQKNPRGSSSQDSRFSKGHTFKKIGQDFF